MHGGMGTWSQEMGTKTVQPRTRRASLPAIHISALHEPMLHGLMQFGPSMLLPRPGHTVGRGGMQQGLRTLGSLQQGQISTVGPHILAAGTSSAPPLEAASARRTWTGGNGRAGCPELQPVQVCAFVLVKSHAMHFECRCIGPVLRPLFKTKWTIPRCELRAHYIPVERQCAGPSGC